MKTLFVLKKSLLNTIKKFRRNLLKKRVTAAMTTVKPFLSHSQFMAMNSFCSGEEGSYYMHQFIELARRIKRMPATYEQDGAGGRAIAYLHYFWGESDWYIMEKDIDGGVAQAFGYAVLNGDGYCAELGYISIDELVQVGAELDLHFPPCPLEEIKAKRQVAY